MTVIYIDETFARDALADLFLLTAAARLAGARPPWGRLVLASGLGGLYAAAALLPGWGFLTTVPVTIAAGVGIALTAFGGEADLFRLTVLFFAVSCGFAGLVMALGPLWGGPGPGRLALPALLLWALLGTAASLRRGRPLTVRVSVGGRISELTALWDSGNGLREDGRPVLVAAPGSVRLPEGAAAVLDASRLRDPASAMGPLMRAAPGLRPRLTPYRAVGVDAGMLLSVESDWAEIGGVRWPRLRVALSPTALGEGHQALWGGPAGGRRRDRRERPGRQGLRERQGRQELRERQGCQGRQERQEGGERHGEDLGDVPASGEAVPAGRRPAGRHAVVRPEGARVP